MEKVQTSFVNKNLTKQREEALLTIKESGIFDDFIEKYEINEIEIMQNASKFLSVLEERKICKNCSGLENCKKKIKGTMVELCFDNNGELDLKLAICPEQNKFLKIEDKFYYNDFPLSYLKYKLKDTLNEDYKPMRKSLIEHLSKIIKGLDNKGVYLTGDRQVGKTFIMSVFSKVYAEQTNNKVAYLDSTNRIRDLNDLYFTNKENFSNLLNDLINLDLLVFDDFGNEYKNEIVRDVIIFPLINERMKKHKITCFISSYTLDEIEIMYALKERISPKARQLKDIISLSTKSFYLKGLPYRE